VQSRTKAFPVLFYGGLALVLALILLERLDDLIGSSPAAHIGHNSETYLAAIVLGGWIQYVRPRLTDTRYEWVVAIAVGVVLLAIGIALVQTHLPSRFRTLNEAFVAVGLLVPYLQLRRPLPRAVSIGVPAALILLVLAVGDVGVVKDQAESVVMLILIPIGFDLVDRGILQSDAVTSVRTRWAWYAALVLVPIVFVALRKGAHVGGWAGDRMLYSQRGLEGYLLAFFLEVYFAVFLGWVGRRVTPAGRATPATARN
jgi:hypothetical protein